MKYLRMKTLLGGMGLLLMVAGLFDVSHAREMEMQELNPLQSQDVKAFGKKGEGLRRHPRILNVPSDPVRLGP